METLETRALMSASPLSASAPSIAAGDTVIPIHAQVGSTALEKVLGAAATLDTVQQALNAYLNEIPGWHLTGGIDKTPSYSGKVDGSVVIGSNGLLKSANVTLAGSADIGATIEGYYGVSVLHVGLGAAADLSANVNATASFSVATNTWNFGGSASLVGYVKGYAAAMAWPLKGEVYVRGNLQAAAAIDSGSGLASASVQLVGSVGADAQLRSLFGGWTTIASVSRSLGSWQCNASFDVGAWMQAEVNTAVVATRATAANAQSIAIASQTTTAKLGAGVAAPAAAALETQGTTVRTSPVATVAQGAAAALPATANSLVAAAAPQKSDATADLTVVLLHDSALQDVLSSNPLSS